MRVGLDWVGGWCVDRLVGWLVGWLVGREVGGRPLYIAQANFKLTVCLRLALNSHQFTWLSYFSAMLTDGGPMSR